MAQSAQDAATSYGEPTLEGQSPTEVPIVVTGSRLREESVQDTPLAVSVLSEASVEDLHAPDIQGLSAVVPTLNVTTQGAQPNAAVVNLRGFGVVTTAVSFDPGVSVSHDAFYHELATLPPL